MVADFCAQMGRGDRKARRKNKGAKRRIIENPLTGRIRREYSTGEESRRKELGVWVFLIGLLFGYVFSGLVCAFFWLDESFYHCRETNLILAANTLEL